jgi:CHAT domain-containing protein
MRSCVAALRSNQIRWPFFGDPSDDRKEAREVTQRLAARFGVAPLLAQDATRPAFLAALRRARRVHFQGHACYTANEPLDSFLQFAGADGRLSAREIMGTNEIDPELVSLGACQSAVNEIRGGDEPLGLVPALQVAGVRSVLAALWPIDSKSSAAFISAYYERIMNPSAPSTKVDALRNAARALMKQTDFESPYRWGGYVLHGDWL